MLKHWDSTQRTHDVEYVAPMSTWRHFVALTSMRRHVSAGQQSTRVIIPKFARDECSFSRFVKTVQTLIRLLLQTGYSLFAFAQRETQTFRFNGYLRSAISNLYSLKCQMQVQSESLLFIYGVIKDLVNLSMRPENRSEFKSRAKLLHSVCKQQLPSNVCE